MSDAGRMVGESAERMFAAGCGKAVLDEAERGVYPVALHDVVVGNGLDQAGVAEHGLEFADVFELLKVAGRHAVPLPLAEMLLAHRWFAGAPARVSIGRAGTADDEAVDVPWGREAGHVVRIAASGHLSVGRVAEVVRGVNVAGEPRDAVSLTDIAPLPPVGGAFEFLALTRVALMAGALERVLDLGLAYASEREQFGRTISKFQAIQHTLAVVAAEVAASLRATDAAIDSLADARFALELAAAKARVGEAVGIVAEAVHQVHGAMGYTHEHTLHHLTRRLWAWRDEYGNEAFWQRRLGSAIAAAGADQVWDFIATRA